MSSSPPRQEDGTVPHTVDPNSCALLGPPALLVQGLMLIIVLASLIIKRQFFEKSKRTWRVWLMDVSKQLSGQAVVHMSNLLISDQVAQHGNSNPCSTYFLNILVDTTIGVVFIYIALKGLTWIFSVALKIPGCVSGKYGNPPRINYLIRQTGIYIGSLLLMKGLVLILFYFALPSVLLPFANWLLGWMTEWTQVVFVMALFPLLMNVLQFCLIDQLIKASSTDTSGSNDPLLPKHADDIDSDDELDDHRGRHAAIPGSPVFSAHSSQMDMEEQDDFTERRKRKEDEEGTKEDEMMDRSSAIARTKSGDDRPTVVPSSPLLDQLQLGGGRRREDKYGSLSNPPSPREWTTLQRSDEGGSRGRSRSRDSSRSRANLEQTSSTERKNDAEAVAQQVARILENDSAHLRPSISPTTNTTEDSMYRSHVSDELQRQARRSLSSESGIGEMDSRRRKSIRRARGYHADEGGMNLEQRLQMNV